MSNVNNYYLGSLERIFGAELEEGLITKSEARELCAKKYIRPHITDENLLATPLTEQELASVLLVFPDLNKEPVPLRALSPMVRRLSDPCNMGATPTHQADVQEVDTDIFGDLKTVIQVRSHYQSLLGSPSVSQAALWKVCSTWKDKQFAKAVAKRSAKMAAWEALHRTVHQRRTARGVAPPVI